MLNYSTSEENYIKAIYHLQGQEATVTTNELANELKTKPASVTDMMKKLKVYAGPEHPHSAQQPEAWSPAQRARKA